MLSLNGVVSWKIGVVNGVEKELLGKMV